MLNAKLESDIECHAELQLDLVKRNSVSNAGPM